jgi:ferritin-like metal-binding protein YciE
VHAATTADTRDAAIIGAAQRIEHYVLAAYGSARTCARRLNRSDEARLLQETLNDESRTGERLTAIVESSIGTPVGLDGRSAGSAFGDQVAPSPAV